MEIEYDEAKRRKTLEERGLDFARAGEVFVGREWTFIDDRIDYGEQRFNTFGQLDGRLVTLVWTLRNDNRRIISMRKANEREQARYQRVMD
ncbi:MAG: BrnT family toxin [Porphyrobacter sp.]|nr:BrnT family toxin [Porphyrobacter sp.]